MKMAITVPCECGTKLIAMVPLSRGTKLSENTALTECHKCGLIYEVSLQAFARKRGIQRAEHRTGE
jgi:hypothetical protein